MTCHDKSMYRVTLLYPKIGDASFDHDYYSATHMPLVASKLGDICDSWSVDKVVNGRFEAIGYLYINDPQAFGAAMAENREEFTQDIANCTTIAPEVVLSEISAGSN